MMLRCGTGPMATRKASTASIFLDPSFRAAEFFGLVQGSPPPTFLIRAPKMIVDLGSPN